MADQKLENLLSLSLEATPEERLKSVSLGVGYNSTNDHWEVIVRHTGDEPPDTTVFSDYCD